MALIVDSLFRIPKSSWFCIPLGKGDLPWLELSGFGMILERRLLSLAAIYDGMNRTEASKIGGMDRQTLRDWVHRFSEAGPSGLLDRKGPKRC